MCISGWACWVRMGSFGLLLWVCGGRFAFAQETRARIPPDIESAFSVGNSHALASWLSTRTSISIEAAFAPYSKKEARLLLKSFFDKYPPRSFEMTHKGQTKKKLVYGIARYVSSTKRFRIYILLSKPKGGKEDAYRIDTLSISEEKAEDLQDE